MKLIIREYLASLRERNELDALLPDLLSQMGLNVFSKPGLGVREYGVDVAAFGKIDDQPEKVYLFSVKSGDLGRQDWNNGSPQDLQPSLDEIRTVYIPTHLPSEYKSFPVEICICFGGDIKREIDLNVATYEGTHATEALQFRRWGGERLSNLIEQHFLREDLLPKNCRTLMRKSLAMLDEPDASYRYFRELMELLFDNPKEIDAKKTLTAIRQLYICLWIQYTWCRDANNIESAYRVCELSFLNAWSNARPFFEQKNKVSIGILETLHSMQSLLIQINEYFFTEKIFPHTRNLHALSNAINPSCSVDVNLKLFDILGRMSLSGIWLHWYLQSIPDNEDNAGIKNELRKKITTHFNAIKSTIANNPSLLSPYKDDQAIDIAITLWFLSLDSSNNADVNAWLSNMVGQIDFLFATNGQYPCNINNYHELIEYPKLGSDDYRESITKGSILYPYISLFAAVHGFDEVYKAVQSIKKNYLEKCNFQMWFPGVDTEEYLYSNKDNHGGTLSHLPIHKEKEEFLSDVFKECEESNHLKELSAIKFRYWPVVFMACRHYRLPIPIHFIKDITLSKKGKA
ncbi:hypothetical protein [Teredinibacter haidensis]|uniref:hypothetical protein n=1 Tax=Teredinibacter haidensis TaxID=2731755 RepID=UPI000948D36D|nr:hypothetical protein [Teredinibacter haidensis]